MNGSAKAELLYRRDAASRAIRSFFHGRGFLEVDTPVLVSAPANEEYIDAIPADDAWLRTSPELQMKQLVVAGCRRLFQLGPCFRLGEHGRRHRPEFTMLEWYFSPGDYRSILLQTVALLRAVAEELEHAGSYQGKPLDLQADVEVITVAEAFRRHAGIEVEDAMAVDRFEIVLVEQVEPKLGQGKPTFLVDYPAEMASLARLNADDPTVAERWELYLAGIEIANAYGELTDPVEQRQRFLAAAAHRTAHGRPAYPLDEDFLEALADMPPTAGCALGVDRLLMILLDAPDIAHVLPFP